MKRIVPPLLFAASAMCTTPALARDPLRLAPAEPWTLSYEDNACELAQRFGAGEEEVILSLRSYEPGGRFWLTAVGQPTKIKRSAAVIRIELGEVEHFDVRYTRGTFHGLPGFTVNAAITLGPLSEATRAKLLASQPVASLSDPEFERQIREIAFEKGFDRRLVLETGSMHGPIAALKECTRELTTHWEIDVGKHEGLSRVAVPTSSVWTWVDFSDYPRELQRTGVVNFRLVVDEGGKLTACHVTDPGATPEFAKATCDQIRENADFEPALDAEGKPTSDYFVSWTVLRTDSNDVRDPWPAFTIK